MDTKKILVIDDDEIIIKTIQSILEACKFHPITAMNGEDGLHEASSKKPDVILLDRKMPGLSGNAVLKRLKQDPETQNIPVVMLTGDNNISDVAKSLELGAQDYIVKPFIPENLIVRIKNVLH